MSWAEYAIDAFFKDRKSPSREACDKLAIQITGASMTRSVNAPGSLSYTIICDYSDKPSTIISFREEHSTLDDAVLTMATSIHGHLVPLAIPRGEMPLSDPKLLIYEIPLLPGYSVADVIECEKALDVSSEQRQFTLVRDLALYFSRCWINSQELSADSCRQLESRIRQRLAQFGQYTIISDQKIQELFARLPQIFSEENPRVLAHCDLSETNILMDSDTGHITGLVDWSLATVMPFDFELDVLLLLTGFRDREGWHDYSCKSKLVLEFWETFWTSTKVADAEQARLLEIFTAAAKIGAILQFAFVRNENGSPSMDLRPIDQIAPQLQVWCNDYPFYVSHYHLASYD